MLSVISKAINLTTTNLEHLFTLSEVVSKNLDVDKSKVYVNTSTTTDGAILKVGNKYYRAISGSEPDSYLLEQIKLYKSDVELVEVKK